MSDEVLMTREDANDLDDVVRVLGIESSEITPAEAVQQLLAEIECLRAELAAALARAEKAEAALRVVDADVRHHSRSDATAAAMIRPHAVKAVRAALATAAEPGPPQAFVEAKRERDEGWPDHGL